MTPKELRCCIAELIGAFAIVFFGCGAIMTDIGHVGVNLVFGGVVAAMIFALGHVSCAHFNPAVTVAFAVSKRFPWRMALPYVLSQLLGAILAAVLLRFLVIPTRTMGATVPSVGVGQAVIIEVILTFFLMLVIISVATDARVPKGFAGIAIGMTVALAGLMAGPLTGCSMNPARSFGPALFSGPAAMSVLWLYIVGPIVGAALGALTYEFLRAPIRETLVAPNSCCSVD